MWKLDLFISCGSSLLKRNVTPFTTLERWGGSVCDTTIWYLNPRPENKRTKMKAGGRSLSASFWQRITWPGSNTLLRGVDKESFPGQSRKHTALIWICAFIFDTVCYSNYEGCTDIVSVHVHERLCARLSHCFSVTVCAERGLHVHSTLGQCPCCPDALSQRSKLGQKVWVTSHCPS